jgi:hypothetical protein
MGFVFVAIAMLPPNLLLERFTVDKLEKLLQNQFGI